MTNQLGKVIPKTALGWWSVGLIVTMPILFFLGNSFTDTFYSSVSAGNTIPADLSTRPALALTMLTGMAAGIAALITGLLAVIKRQERSLLVYVSAILGALFLVYLGAEILFPH